MLRGWRVQLLTMTHMHTHMYACKDPTSAGYHQNPISVYYCYNLQGALDICIAEVTNTPWGERVRFLFKVRGWWMGQGGGAVMYDGMLSCMMVGAHTLPWYSFYLTFLPWYSFYLTFLPWYSFAAAPHA